MKRKHSIQKGPRWRRLCACAEEKAPRVRREDAQACSCEACSCGCARVPRVLLVNAACPQACSCEACSCGCARVPRVLLVNAACPKPEAVLLRWMRACSSGGCARALRVDARALRKEEGGCACDSCSCARVLLSVVRVRRGGGCVRACSFRSCARVLLSVV